ncbi:Ubiquitin recognition factor in ER-associated degradation protein 1, partial [Perkinsus olseni]
ALKSLKELAGDLPDNITVRGRGGWCSDHDPLAADEEVATESSQLQEQRKRLLEELREAEKEAKEVELFINSFEMFSFGGPHNGGDDPVGNPQMGNFLQGFFGAMGSGGTFDVQYHCYPVSFLGREELEKGNKILLPQSALDQLARLNVSYPMLFQISNLKE